MAKYHIDIIINDRSVKMTELIDFEKYKLQGQIGYFDDQECQITSGIDAKRFDGYANLNMTNLEYFFSIDEMYGKGTLDQLQLLRETALCAGVLYSGKFGFLFLSKMLDFIHERCHGKEIYILEDQTDNLYQFSDFYKKHQTYKFFWLPSGNTIAEYLRKKSILNRLKDFLLLR
jgi:hypothetical protein